MSSLLTHHGLPTTEPMAFGLGAALAFAYVPFIKLSGMPLIGYRMPPRHIIKGLSRRLAIGMKTQTFRDPDSGMATLDRLLDEGRVVGLQTSVYWLPYFPETMRFHFNAHNLIVYGREGGEYLVSDPVFEEPVRCAAAALKKARFARGALAARGLLYYPTQVPATFDIARAARSAIRANNRYMTGAPLPVIGIRGIRYLGKTISRLAANASRRETYLPQYLGHIVRMQEEIGTGGAGFRFMYASFLRETANAIGSDLLAEAADLLAEAGDNWRMFALTSSKMCKGRSPLDGDELARQLNVCADQEAATWRLLQRF